MEIGHKIKQLRIQSGLTQEQLAGRLGVSAQSVSKWENALTMPDITLLPMLAGEFGVSIDELFDLSTDQKLNRIERRLDFEAELPSDIFKEYEEFLQGQLAEHPDKTRILSLLAYLYHHRMEADGRRVSRYAREAIHRSPEKKDCQWFLQMAEGAVTWDWNIANHAAIIDFYKSVIEGDHETPKTPLPYYAVIDNLLADRRTEEAAAYVEIYRTLPAHKPCMVPVYEAYIALAAYDEPRADGIMEEVLRQYPNDGILLFEAAQYYARKAEYETAIRYYERSWACDPKPRHTDAMQGISVIYEILGDYAKAAATQEHLVECLKTEWGYADDDKAVLEAEREKSRLLNRCQRL